MDSPTCSNRAHNSSKQQILCWHFINTVYFSDFSASTENRKRYFLPDVQYFAQAIQWALIARMEDRIRAVYWLHDFPHFKNDIYAQRACLCCVGFDCDLGPIGPRVG